MSTRVIASANYTRHVAPGSLKCSKYHGTSKATEVDIIDSDVVLTTYATLISDSHHKGGLHSFHWFRIVIDEGIRVSDR
jgi:SWI/SNF-related matrix-associated actin-dependent regulator of chromatin subfamily A3